MSQLYADREAMLSAMNEFFTNHPEVPRISDAWGPIADYIFDNGMTPTLSNFEYVFRIKRAEIESALDSIPPERWKKEIVIPEFQKRQAEQPKQESIKPLGVSWSQFLNNG